MHTDDGRARRDTVYYPVGNSSYRHSPLVSSDDARAASQRPLRGVKKQLSLPPPHTEGKTVHGIRCLSPRSTECLDPNIIVFRSARRSLFRREKKPRYKNWKKSYKKTIVYIVCLKRTVGNQRLFRDNNRTPNAKVIRVGRAARMEFSEPSFYLPCNIRLFCRFYIILANVAFETPRSRARQRVSRLI